MPIEVCANKVYKVCKENLANFKISVTANEAFGHRAKIYKDNAGEIDKLIDVSIVRTNLDINHCFPYNFLTKTLRKKERICIEFISSNVYHQIYDSQFFLISVKVVGCHCGQKNLQL